MTTSVPVLHLTPKPNKLEENIIKNSPQLFKPLPIKIRKNENNLNFPIPIITNDSNIPIIYPKLQYGSIPNINFSSPQLNNVMLYEKSKNRKILDSKTKPCCSCIKTKCIKKYCECFANNKSCTSCICIDCRNKEIYTNIQNKENTPNKEIVFCTCAKSGCNKKYCECYKEGLKCNIKCRCVKCLNCDENENLDKANDNEKNLSLDETRCESGKKSTSGELCEFNIEKISVLIGKTQTYINIEKLCKEDFELLCKKRKTSF
jgi:hypothetical protein